MPYVCSCCNDQWNHHWWFPGFLDAKCASGSKHKWEWKTDHAASMEKLQATGEVVEKREAVLQRRIEEQERLAREALGKKKKEEALRCLKRKKLFEAELAKLRAQQDNLAQIQMAYEQAQMNAETFEAQRQAAEALKRLKLKDADKVMDDARDAMQQVDDVADALSQPVGQPLDEDELEAEFRQLQLESSEPVAGPAKVSSRPVPKAKTPEKPVTEDAEDDEESLKQLEAQLA
eukprot:TRINITY_DN1293_c0_g1_i1.p1 TRINITY_DN1293_c0_g1~~TRINITY_DN1293_c0_g1_i1.p1  ORF type:complete len:233 (-),score=64.32 TRINITY_DN1293_c0_g1_i1:156-854(-)